MSNKDKSITLWYPRYCGDYQRKTAHLSLIEHGIYTVLLDFYYSTGKPLSANAEVLQRICRAFAPQDAEALQSVLHQFFTLEDDGYHNSRADAEIAKRLDIKEKRSNSAKIKHQKYPANAGANAGANADTPTPTPTPTLKRTRTPKIIDNNLFDDFWDLYTRKTNKQEAIKSYNSAIKKGVSHETIIAGIRKFAAEWSNWSDHDQQYIPHASTWINGRRWEEEPERKARASNRLTDYERAIQSAVEYQINKTSDN